MALQEQNHSRQRMCSGLRSAGAGGEGRECVWGTCWPKSSPDVGGFTHRRLLNDLWGHKFWGAVLAVLWLSWGEFLGKAKVADFNVFPSRVHHQDVGGLLGRVREG